MPVLNLNLDEEFEVFAFLSKGFGLIKSFDLTTANFYGGINIKNGVSLMLLF